MNQKPDFKALEYKSIFFSLMCIFGIMVFIFGGIVSKQKSLARLNQKTNDIRFQTEEQKNLLPTYKFLKDLLGGKPKTLPFPEAGKLPRDRADKIYEIFKYIARKSNMEFVTVIPDMNTVTAEDSFTLSVTIEMKGDYYCFQKFLSGLGELLCLEHIEEIEIHQTPGTREYKMKVMLAVTNVLNAQTNTSVSLGTE